MVALGFSFEEVSPMTYMEVGTTLADVERAHILGTLAHCNGNRTRSAKLLNISIRCLRNRLRQYTESGMPVPAPGSSEMHQSQH
jgi:two-component system response regulator FlrC